ncbi:MAG: tetraacyldisaccharide 4'-kinase [Planctomycetales bacterium]|nr:tetraacyldisaccharide 4'-kinase [Planctomycetales bacterium]
MQDLRTLVTHPNPTLPVRLVRIVLRVLSWPYQCVVFIRNLLFDLGVWKSFQSPLPVICVGNLSVGGTGKTPTVIWIAKWLREQDKRVAILSRGYGQLDSGQNDEALELEMRLPDVPHLQNADRVKSARLAHEELEMQVLLLDDGFQHRRLARTLDIVLVDATDSAAAQRVLPAGLFREPFSSLQRAHAAIITRTNLAARENVERIESRIRQANASLPVIRATHVPCDLWSFPNTSIDLQYLQGKRLLAFCGIGNPQSFFQLCQDLGGHIIDRMIWPDHHPYSAGDVQRMQSWALAHQADCVVCTVKDLVKLQTAVLGTTPLKAIAVDIQIEAGQEELEGLLRNVTLFRSYPNKN